MRFVFVGLLALLAAAIAAAQAPAGHPRFVQTQAMGNWVYQFKVPDGQDQWSGYCNQAGTQSPVMIRPLKEDEVKEDPSLNPLVITYPPTHPGRFVIARTHKTVVFAPYPGETNFINATGAALVKGENYKFQHAYFHSPSEHLIEGINTDLEWTFVFRDEGVKSISPLEEHPLQEPAPPREDPHKKRLRLLKEKAQEYENHVAVREAIENAFLEVENELRAEHEGETEHETEAQLDTEQETEAEAEAESESHDEAEFGPFKKQVAQMKKEAEHEAKREGANFAHVSILFRIGRHNKFLQQLLDEFKGNLDLHYRKAVVEFKFGEFFNQFTNEDSAYFTYAGSHTAPPCRADVIWTIYAKILELSNEQLQKLREYSNDGKDNRRDVQSLGKRKILAYAYNAAKSAKAAEQKKAAAAAAIVAKAADDAKKAAEEEAKKKAEAEKKAAEAAAEQAKKDAEAAAEKAKKDAAAAKKAEEDAAAAKKLAELEAKKAAAGSSSGAAAPAATAAAPKVAFRQKVMAKVIQRATEYLNGQHA